MADIKEVFTGLLSTTLQMDEAGVASLFNEDGSVKDDALNVILEKDKARIAAVKPDTKKIFDDGYRKAQGETLTKFEREFMEKTGYKSDKKGLDLVLEYAAAQAKNTDITEDTIQKHPVFVKKIDELSKQIEAAKAEGETKLKELLEGQKKKEVFSKVSESALTMFKGWNPILSPDEKKAAAQVKELLLDKLAAYDFDILEGGRIIVMKDGKVLNDDHSNPITYEKLVKQIADERFDYKKAEDRSSAGNKGAPGAGGDIQMPKNEEEYLKLANDQNIPLATRNKIAEYWAEQQKKQS